jgi:release factor glutamine methyltransferase
MGDIETLLAQVLDVDKAWLVAHEDAELNEEQVKRFAELVDRYRTGEPLAYILGRAGFYRREFVVDERVLVPRPETEHLIDETIGHLRAHEHPRILDVGTGSGNIACTLAAELPKARVDATDISKSALEVARENRDRLGVKGRVRFFQGDLVDPVATRRYNAIVANLPYVPSADIALDPDPVSYEPPIALNGGPDGLEQYRRLFPQLPQMLEPSGIVLAEAAPPSIKALAYIAQTAFPDACVTIHKDYAGQQRYITVS